MTWNYAYTPYFWPFVYTVLLLLVLSAYSWRRRSVPGALPLTVNALINVIWVIGILLENSAEDSATKIFWFKFEMSWILLIVNSAACFILEYTWPRRWLTRRNLALLSTPWLLLVLLVLTNDLHHQIWSGFIVAGDLITPVRGAAAWIFIVYGMGLSLLNLSILCWLMARSPQNRWAVLFILIGQIVSRGAFVLQTMDILPANLPYKMFWIAFEFLMYAIALFGFRILDPIALAREAVIEQMTVGMLVLDTEGKVISINPAAEQILDTSTAGARGQPLQKLLPACPEEHRDQAGGSEFEFTLPQQKGIEANGPARCYTLTTSLLKDWRGVFSGRLVLLRDVTLQKHAQAQLLSQQWAQATLQEREQLANELHDGISQSLAFINTQAQATQLYLQAEQGEAARASLTRMAEVSRELQGDLRELIGSLLVSGMPSEGFCSTLRQLATAFEKQSGLPVCLEIDEPAAALCDSDLLPAPAGVQLIRIIQEALANVRKHAENAGHVHIWLRIESGQLWLAVNDDGAGFDPQTPRGGLHFGLHVMQKRAEQIGGQLAVHSAPGVGTKVEVRLPLGGREVQGVSLSATKDEVIYD